MKKTINQLGLILGAVAGLAGAGYYLLFRRPLPKKSGTLNLKGLHNPVRILRDEWGVPHIFAEFNHRFNVCTGVCARTRSSLANGI